MANSLWMDLARKGLASERPVTMDVNPDQIALYYATDTSEWSMYTGSAWVEVASPSAISSAAAGTGVVVDDRALAARKMKLILDAVEVAVADGDDFGSSALATLPDSNLLVLGVEAVLDFTKDGTGYVAATDLDIAIGTAAASNTTLSAGMVNLLAKQDVDADSLTPSLAAHSLAASPTLLGILDAADNQVFLNVSGPTETSQSATLTAEGSVTITYIDLGNEAG